MRPKMADYKTHYPASVRLYGDPRARKITYDDNQDRVLVTEVSSPLQTLESIFLREGFSRTMLEEKKRGQISQGLVKRLTADWDMHVRFIRLHRGSIAVDAEVETSREYLEHLGGRWISVIYEVIEILQRNGLECAIWHKRARRYVSSILRDGRLGLDWTSGKTEWKPAVAGAAAGAAVGIIIGLLLNLREDE